MCAWQRKRLLEKHRKRYKNKRYRLLHQKYGDTRRNAILHLFQFWQTVSLSQAELLSSFPEMYLTLCNEPQTCNLYSKSKLISELHM